MVTSAVVLYISVKRPQSNAPKNPKVIIILTTSVAEEFMTAGILNQNNKTKLIWGKKERDETTPQGYTGNTLTTVVPE